MILVIMGEQNQVDVREVVKVNGWVGLASASYARPEMNMVTGVEEVGLRRPVSGRSVYAHGTACIGHESDTLPFSSRQRLAGRLLLDSVDVYSIVVAVPTKKILAFSLPDFLG